MPKNNFRNKTKRPQSNQRQNGAGQAIVSLPKWLPEPIYTRTMRFKVNGTLSNDTFTYEDVAAGVVGIIALTASTSAHIARAIRIRRIQVWFLATAVGTHTEGILDWDADVAQDIYSPETSQSVSTMSTAGYAHLSVVPPKNANQNMWHLASSADDVITMSLPAGALIEITVDYVMNDSEANLTGPAVSGATVGLMYHKQINADASVIGNLNTIA